MSCKLRSIALLAIIASVAHSTVASAACGKASGEPAIRLRVYSPLVMTQIGASTDIAIDAAGCVMARYPATDKRHGVHSFDLPRAEFDVLQREVRAARLDTFDAIRVKEQLSADAIASSPSIEYLTTDPDIVQLEVAYPVAGSKSPTVKSIRWTGMDQDLLNPPEVRQLHALAAVKARLMELAVDSRLGMGAQP